MEETSHTEKQLKMSPAWTAWSLSGGQYLYPPHIRLIDDYLTKASRRKIPRLVVNMPPRHGKSELISKFFPFWYLGNFPDHRVLLTSYEATFAASWGRKVRDLMAERGSDLFGIKLDPSSKSASDFNIFMRDGGMSCAGSGGAITGKGADLLIIDDPVKNDTEAMSITYRESVWDWFASVAYTRLAPGGIIVVVMTRWHEDDLCGRLMKSDIKNKGTWPWTWLRLPVYANSDDVLGRPKGEILWPERFPSRRIEDIRKTIGEFWFSALYQQQPSPATGGIFKRKYFRYYEGAQDYYILKRDGGEDEKIPQDRIKIYAVADLAATLSQTSDYTVVLIFGLTEKRDTLVLDIIRERFEGADHLNMIKNVNRRWRPVLIGVESSQYQISLVQSAMREGLPVRELKPDSDKLSRALPMAARMESGTVYFPADSPWLDDFEKELLSFPKGKHDDQVDALAYIVEIVRPVSGALPAGVSFRDIPGRERLRIGSFK